MAYSVEFVARLKDEVTGKLRGMAGAAKELQSNLKAGFVDGVRSALPEQLGFVADKLEALPIGALAAGGALIAVGSAAVKMAQDVADSALAFDKLSQKTGASVEFLSTFTEVAKDTDVSAEQVATALQMLSRQLAETGNGSVSVQQELLGLADTFAAMPDGPQKTALAMQAFGRSGAEMIPILNQGSVALKESMSNMQAMGRIITSETVAAANRFDDAMDALGGRLNGLKNTIGSAVLPALVDLTAGLEGAATQFDLAGDAIQQLSQNGQVNALTMAQLRAAYYDQLVAVATLTPSMFALRDGFIASRDAAYKEVDALQNVATGAGTATSTVAKLGPAAVMSASTTRSAAAIFIAAAGDFYAGIKLMDSARAQTARYAQQALNIQYEQGLAKARANSAYAARYAAQADAERNRVLSDTEGLRAQRLESMAAEQAIDALNAQFDEVKVSGGGAAAAINEVTDAQKALQEAQQNVGGMLGQSLSTMDELARVQTAYALATGQLSTEQFAQQQAVKAVMQATKDKAISEDQAVATALSLAAGIASTKDAYDIAGPSGARFAEEQAKVQAAADNAGQKVRDMGLALKNLPPSTIVDVVATVKGMDQIANAKRELLDLHDRQYTAYVNVVYRKTGTPPSNSSSSGRGNGRPMGGEIDGSGASGISSAQAGNAYKIGEDGPEWFVPNVDGAVVPSYKMKGANMTPAVINLVVDGRTLARVVAPHLR